MTFVNRQNLPNTPITRVTTRYSVSSKRKAYGKSPGYQSPALATLVYVDSDCSLPTGQWSAVSATV